MAKISYEVECRNPVCPTVIAALVGRIKAGDDEAEEFLGLTMAAAARLRWWATMVVRGEVRGAQLAAGPRDEAFKRLLAAEDALGLERERFDGFCLEATREQPSETIETPCPACGTVDDIVAL